MEYKTCSRCKTERPIEDFGLDNRRNSPKAVCKPCDSEIHKERYRQFGMTQEQKQRKRVMSKVRYERRKVSKRCADCGEPTEGGIFCKTCGNDRARAESMRREEKRAAKACRGCGSPEVRFGHNLCDDCSTTTSPRFRKYQKSWRDEQKQQIVNIYGGKCACCGEKNIKFLTIDHINNDGAAHRKAINPNTGRARIYPWLKKHSYPPGFRVLCFNCNCGRAYNGGICPHVEQQETHPLEEILNKFPIEGTVN